MSTLRRELAPLDDAQWSAVESEARDVLRQTLAARHFVDFDGPRGWDFAGQGTGRCRELTTPVQGVGARARSYQPVVEYRRAFALALAELDALARGADAVDLGATTEAARDAALAEDRVVFHGFDEARVSGIWAVAGGPVSLTDNYHNYPHAVIEALARMQGAGVAGPYGIALGDRCWQGLLQTVNEGGYPVLNVVRNLLDGPLVRAPAIDGALVMSLRGGDFRLTAGRDWSVGYLDHDRDTVHLYLEASFTFSVTEGAAAVALAYDRPAPRTRTTGRRRAA